MSLSELNRVANSGIVKFSNTDVSVYETIIKKSKYIQKMSATEIANLVPCNHSSVSRFIKKCGFRSWNDFTNSIVFEEKLVSTIGIDSIQEKINLEIINAQRTLVLPEIQANLDKIVDIIIASEKNLIFYGHRMSGNIAQFLTWNFTVSGLFATHTYFIDELFGLLDSNGIVIIFSDPEGAHECIEAARRSRLLGAKVISINIDGDENIQQLSHIDISVPSLSYFEDYEHKSILKKELMRHIGLVIWEKWIAKK